MIDKVPMESQRQEQPIPVGKGVQVSLRLSEEMLRQIERLGGMLGFQRSDAIRYLLGLGLHQSQAVRGIRDQCDTLERLADLEMQALRLEREKMKGGYRPPRR